MRVQGDCGVGVMAGENGAVHGMRGGSVSLADMQQIIFDQMRSLQAVDPHDREAVESACDIADAVRGLAGVAIDNANTALWAKALARDIKLAGVELRQADSRMLEP